MTDKRIDVFEDEAGKWRWRLWSSSDIVSGSLEGYDNRAHAIHMARELHPDVEVRMPADDDE